MKGSTKRKCPACSDFYLPDRRNLWHQCYCPKAACRKLNKAESQRRWLQKPENQNYFCGPENNRRIQEWRKRNPGYWRKKHSTSREPLQEVCTEQVAQNEEITKQRGVDALQDLLLLQPVVLVGLISTMTGSSLQEDIAATAQALVRRGRDILGMRPGATTTCFNDENQTATLSRTAQARTAPV